MQGVRYRTSQKNVQIQHSCDVAAEYPQNITLYRRKQVKELSHDVFHAGGSSRVLATQDPSRTYVVVYLTSACMESEERSNRPTYLDNITRST